MTAPYEVVTRPVRPSVVRPPGSKSITNRALLVAALAPGTSEILAPLVSEDTEAMERCLQAMGVRIGHGEGAVEVRSTGHLRGAALDVGASGTTARFITAAATLADGESIVDGTERMRQRPIGDLVDVLRRLGAEIDHVGEDDVPPLRIQGGTLRGGRTGIDVSRSSQFASAVMLAAPRAEQATILELGDVVVSRPYLQTTIEVMEAFGAHASFEGDDTIRVESTGYRPARFLVEADASAAVYPWAVGALTGVPITVAGIDPSSTQADMRALDIMRAMGCHVAWDGNGITVTGPQQLGGVDADLNDAPDSALALAVLAAFAAGPTRFRSLGTLRIKETDRLEALRTELTRLGASVSLGHDWIEITPGPTRPATIATYDDHRMAMSFAVAGLRQEGISIEDPGCVAKTWPEFFDMLESLS